MFMISYFRNIMKILKRLGSTTRTLNHNMNSAPFQTKPLAVTGSILGLCLHKPCKFQSPAKPVVNKMR